MSKFRSQGSALASIFVRRDKNTPPGDEVTADIAGTLKEISQQVYREATEKRSVLEEDFFSPTHVLKPEAMPAEAIQDKREKAEKRRLLRPDQYERIIESSMSALYLSGQIIDRNRVITARLK